MRLKTLYPAGLCKGITKQGKRCRSREVDANGLCRHHGGDVAAMLAASLAEKQRRFDETKSRLLKKAERYMRKRKMRTASE